MTDENDVDRPTTGLASRRIVFHGLGALGVAVALAGCGSSGSSGGSTSAGGGSGSATGGSSADAKAGTVLAKTSEVPENGGVILTDAKVVITQPQAGTYKAFTATCTHQGFLVTSVDGNTINCNHHGSEYNATDGSVKRGPAPASLTAVSIVVQGENIVTG